MILDCCLLGGGRGESGAGARARSDGDPRMGPKAHHRHHQVALAAPVAAVARWARWESVTPPCLPRAPTCRPGDQPARTHARTHTNPRRVLTRYSVICRCDGLETIPLYLTTPEKQLEMLQRHFDTSVMSWARHGLPELHL